MVTLLGLISCVLCNGCLCVTQMLISVPGLEYRQEFGIVAFVKHHLSPCFVTAYLLSGLINAEEPIAKQELPGEIGILEKSQRWEICQPYTEEETGPGTGLR